MAHVAEQPPVAEHSSDWPEQIDVLVFVQPEGDHWSALSLEFDVVGQGDTDDAAIGNMLELLADYLNLVREDGGKLVDAYRPVPARHQVRLVARAVRGALRHRLATARRDLVSLPLNGGGARFAG